MGERVKKVNSCFEKKKKQLKSFHVRFYYSWKRYCKAKKCFVCLREVENKKDNEFAEVSKYY